MEFIGGLVRTGVAAAAGGLVANGVVTAEQVNVISGAVIIILTAAWSLWQKKNAKK